jgi:hypothetical protein
MPIKNTVPNLGTKCGRRERESRREGRREQSLRDKDSFACRGGGKHPGLREGGALRGASSERGSRSVRRLSRVSPRGSGAPMTADARRTPRRGTSSACATKRMHPTQAREIVACAPGTRPSLGPPTRARRSSLCTAGASPGGGAVGKASRLGKPAKAGRTSTGVSSIGRSAARRVSPLPRGRGRGTSEKEGGRGLRPCEDQGPRFGCPHVDETQLQKSVGDVWPRISSAYALQKERSGSSEQWPSLERGSAGDTVGRRPRRNVRRESASPLKTGEDRRKAQGGERSSSSGRHIAESGGAVAGPGS